MTARWEKKKEKKKTLRTNPSLCPHRKHTGERPFQCHCSRRFSRLDNLRQHAQTVHVNEEIPGDSLAATGTRFQRQIRTDRVRPPNRSRASTLGSQGGHSRGHSRNLSTSSIASTASHISQISVREDPRERRPPPLAMANENAARNRLSLDTFNPNLMGGPGPTVSNYGSQSPNGMSTPTSATYSGTGSPRFPSGLQSPTQQARALAWGGGVSGAGAGGGGSRTPGRRLSVPSGTNPFQTPPNGQTPYISPLPSATSSTFSTNSSVYASPTMAGYPESRRDSNAQDADWRRRTWHPSTYTGIGPRPATSGLSYYQTPDAPRPLFSNQPAASQATRLPGIESFDHAPPPPTLPRRQPSPMQVDSQARIPQLAGPFEPSVSRPEDRRIRHNHHASLDLSMQRGFGRLDIASPTPPREQHYAWSENYPGSAPTQRVAAGRPTTAPGQSLYSQAQAQQHQPPPPPLSMNLATRSSPATVQEHQEQNAAEPPATPRRNKRHAWYHGPLALNQQQQHQQHQHPHQQHQHQHQHPHPQPHQPHAPSHSHHSSASSFRTQRTSPEDSSSSEGVPTPSSSLGEYRPTIVDSNGYVESHPSAPAAATIEEQQHQQQQQHKPGVSQLTAQPLAPKQGYPPAPRPFPAPQQPLAVSFAYRPESERMIIQAPTGLGIVAPRKEPANDMRRLEALVAVATGEQQGAQAGP